MLYYDNPVCLMKSDSTLLDVSDFSVFFLFHCDFIRVTHIVNTDRIVMKAKPNEGVDLCKLRKSMCIMAIHKTTNKIVCNEMTLICIHENLIYYTFAIDV